MLRLIKNLSTPALKRAIITSGLEVAGALSQAGLMKSARGRGAIFTLHHVRAKFERRFHPNDILEVTPAFLDTAIDALKAQGYDFIQLEDVPRRLSRSDERPFACFTLDDGNRNNKTDAAPVFTRHNVPFTIFLTKGFVEQTHTLWWETLEALLNKATEIPFDFGGGTEAIPAETPAQKLAAFNRITAFVSTSDEVKAVAQLDNIAAKSGIDPTAITADLIMRADEALELLQNPLVSYGAHTVGHLGLARLPKEQAEWEIAQSVAAVENLVGKKPAAFAYTYGDARSVSVRERQILRDLGIPIGVTTQPGVLRTEMTTDMTALPRISMNGLYQQARYVKALASGIPFKLMK